MIEKIKAMSDNELSARYEELQAAIEDNYHESMLIYQEQLRRIAEEASKKLCIRANEDPSHYEIVRCVAAPGDVFSEAPLDFRIAEIVRTFDSREEAEKEMEELQSSIKISFENYSYEEFALFGPDNDLLAISSHWDEIIIEGNRYILGSERGQL